VMDARKLTHTCAILAPHRKFREATGKCGQREVGQR
jgi:ribosomal protein S27AE